MVQGNVHSIQTMGTLDGPGVRFVVFMQGCRLRCGCCHNPDTWSMEGGTPYKPAALADKAARYREYFGPEGGVTVSGGEPLLQPSFVKAFFLECHKRGMHTCLDTAGSVWSREVQTLLACTDRVLLDIKYTSNEMYQKYVGCSIDAPLSFLRYLNRERLPTTLRQVIIPGLNDTAENMEALSALIRKYPCIDTVELLPFKKICTVKYKKMGISFPFAGYDTPTPEKMRELESML